MRALLHILLFDPKRCLRHLAIATEGTVPPILILPDAAVVGTDMTIATTTEAPANPMHALDRAADQDSAAAETIEIAAATDIAAITATVATAVTDQEAQEVAGETDVGKTAAATDIDDAIAHHGVHDHDHTLPVHQEAHNAPFSSVAPCLRRKML